MIVVTGVAKRRARRAEMSLTPRQLFIGLGVSGILTPAEAVETAKTRNLPAIAEGAISSLSPADQLAARITWATMGVVLRNDPMVDLLGSAAGLTPDQIDEFFATFGTV